MNISSPASVSRSRLSGLGGRSGIEIACSTSGMLPLERRNGTPRLDVRGVGRPFRERRRSCRRAWGCALKGGNCARPVECLGDRLPRKLEVVVDEDDVRWLTYDLGAGTTPSSIRHDRYRPRWRSSSPSPLPA